MSGGRAKPPVLAGDYVLFIGAIHRTPSGPISRARLHRNEEADKTKWHVPDNCGRYLSNVTLLGTDSTLLVVEYVIELGSRSGGCPITPDDFGIVRRKRAQMPKVLLDIFRQQQ